MSTARAEKSGASPITRRVSRLTLLSARTTPRPLRSRNRVVGGAPPPPLGIAPQVPEKGDFSSSGEALFRAEEQDQKGGGGKRRPPYRARSVTGFPERGVSESSGSDRRAPTGSDGGPMATPNTSSEYHATLPERRVVQCRR